MTAASEIEKHPYSFKCDKQWCYYSVCADTLEQAQEIEANHPCPSTGKTTHGWSTIMPAVRDLWEQADYYYDEYKSLQGGDPRQERAAGTLNGFCIALSHIMKPYYPDMQAVASELGKRWEAKKENREHLTAGIDNVTMFPEEPTKWYPAVSGGYTSNPAFAAQPPAGYPSERVEAARSAVAGGGRDYGHTPDAYTDGTGARTVAGAGATRGTGRGRGSSSAPAPKRTFTDEEREAIRTAHAAGFEMKMLTTAYKCTEADIQAVVS